MLQNMPWLLYAQHKHMLPIMCELVQRKRILHFKSITINIHIESYKMADWTSVWVSIINLWFFFSSFSHSLLFSLFLLIWNPNTIKHIATASLQWPLQQHTLKWHKKASGLFANALSALLDRDHISLVVVFAFLSLSIFISRYLSLPFPLSFLSVSKSFAFNCPLESLLYRLYIEHAVH